MSESGRIDLAHAAEFRLGNLIVRPQLRQVAREDGSEEVLEPRVMQVLVALARADGAILSRDDLTHACWDDRVVGEDAINRVISRLRRVAEGIGGGSFRIETVTKVGYRLVPGEAAAAASVAPRVSAAAGSTAPRLPRRAILVAGGAAAVASAGGAAWQLGWFGRKPAAPRDVAEILIQSQTAMRLGTSEGAAQAVGLLRRVTEAHPDYADGWGLLASAYLAVVTHGPPSVQAAYRVRVAQAAARALAIDPHNGYALLARAALDPRRLGWLGGERLAREVLAREPDHPGALSALASLMMAVGRCAESAETIDRLWKRVTPDPVTAYSRAIALWAASRLDEADKAIDEATALFGSHYAVWFSRYFLLMYTGRARDALAMGENADQRPSGIPQWNFDALNMVARAVLSRAPADIDAAVARNLELARQGAGFAENTIQYAAFLGRPDTAFAVADAYYFGKGFQIGPLRYSREQNVYSRAGDRRTRILFMPPTAAIRADSRFDAIVARMGLTQYWQEAGVLPDYRRG